MAERKNGANGNGAGGTSPVDPLAALGAGSGDASGSDGSGGGSSGSAIRDSTGTEFNPDIHVAPDSRNNDGSFRRKRGRRKGSGRSESKAKVHRDLEGTIEAFTRGLAIFHFAMANATRTPELMLSDDEAKALSSAAINVMDQYEIRPDPKIEAILAFVATGGAIYGPRIVAIKMRKAQEKQEQKDGVAGVYGADGTAQGTTSFSPGSVQ